MSMGCPMVDDTWAHFTTMACVRVFVDKYDSSLVSEATEILPTDCRSCLTCHMAPQSPTREYHWCVRKVH